MRKIALDKERLSNFSGNLGIQIFGNKSGTYKVSFFILRKIILGTNTIYVRDVRKKVEGRVST